MLDPREAADGSQNILYENGIARFPFGFAKLDLTTTGLNSGNKVLAVFPFKELDGYTHLIAVTTEKIYGHDRVNEEWDDKTPSGITYNSDIYHPVSYVEIGHNDTDIYIDDDTGKAKSYYHLVVCDGGLTDIQRWAGRYEQDFAPVTMTSGDYGTGQTTHRALQVGMSRSRLILISPQTYNSTTKAWTENNQQVRWPTVGKLQTYTGTGSGFSNLIDTGGHNVWSAPLGTQNTIYQDKGIWALNYVGGTKVFDPVPRIPDLGLLAWHLLVAKNNVHYFMGTDYNVYAYYGGSVKQKIGDKIHKFLQRDLDPEYQNRCWMSFGPENKRLWIFIVPSGSIYVRKVYGLDVRNGSWMVRDFEHVWGSTSGITAVNLIGAETYTVGDTYAEAMETLSAYAGIGGGDLVERYGDVLTDSSVAYSGDVSDISVEIGGLDFSLAAGNFSTDFTENDIMIIADGSDVANTEHGTHFYTCYDVSTNGYSVRSRHDEDCELMEFNSGGTYQIAIANTIDGTTSGFSACVANVVIEGGEWSSGDASGYLYLTQVSGAFQAENLNVGSNLNVASALADCTLLGLVGVADFSSTQPTDFSVAQMWFYSVCSDSNPGETYRQMLDEVRVQERMVIGDADGFVYQFDTSLTTDSGNDIPARHKTPVLDFGKPDVYKQIRKVSYVAAREMTSDGAIWMRYRIDNFDTSDTGWSDYTVDVHDLTAQDLELDIHVNKTAKRVQFEFRDWSGSNFNLKSYEPFADAQEILQADSSGLVYDYDMGAPDKFKRWPGVSVLADGSADGAMYVGYRTGNFDTSNTGWTDYTFDLTSDVLEKNFWINRSSKRLQIRLSEFSDRWFDVRKVNLLPPTVEDNR